MISVTDLNIGGTAVAMRNERKFERALRRAMAERVGLFDEGHEVYARSTTVEGRTYLVDIHSCQCLGFHYHGQCKHNAAYVMQVAAHAAYLAEQPLTTRIG